MFLTSSRALPETNMWRHVFKYESVDALKFLFVSQTSSRHSSKRSVSKQSNHAILRGSNKRLNKSNTSLSANSISSYHQGVSLAILQYFKLLSRVSKTLLRHFPDGHKMLLLHVVIILLIWS